MPGDLQTEIKAHGDGVYPIALLADQWSEEKGTDDTRRKSAQKLCVIAKALGAARTRSELIPFLVEHIKEIQKEDEMDEMLCIIAGQLGSFVELIGGVQYSNLLMEPLIKIAQIQETVVREQVSYVSIVFFLYPTHYGQLRLALFLTGCGIFEYYHCGRWY